MAFVRIKKIKGKEYCYLVQNRWRKGKIRKHKGVKQKVTEYLGKVYRPDKENELGFWETTESEPESYLKLATKEKMIHDLIRFELLKHGFVKNSEIWEKEEVKVNIEKKKIFNKSGAGCVIAINEGYLYSSRIRRLYNYEANGELEEAAPELARLFIESGIDIPKELFIAYYEKV